MCIMPKNLIHTLDPEKILLIPKNQNSASIMALHRSLIAEGVMPLRGNFNMLPGMLSTLSGIKAMGSSVNKVAIIIDDDNLSASALAEIKSLCEERQFCSMRIDANVSLLLHTKHTFKELSVLGNRLNTLPRVVENSHEHSFAC